VTDAYRDHTRLVEIASLIAPEAEAAPPCAPFAPRFFFDLGEHSSGRDRCPFPADFEPRLPRLGTKIAPSKRIAAARTFADPGARKSTSRAPGGHLDQRKEPINTKAATTTQDDVATCPRPYAHTTMVNGLSREDQVTSGAMHERERRSAAEHEHTPQPNTTKNDRGFHCRLSNNS